MVKAAEIDLDDHDLAALRSAAPRKAGGDTVKSRASREKPPISPMDGRRNRVAGSDRQVPLNVDVPPEIKAMVIKARPEFGLSMKAFVAQAIEHYYRTLEIEAQSEAS